MPEKPRIPRRVYAPSDLVADILFVIACLALMWGLAAAIDFMQGALQ